MKTHIRQIAKSVRCVNPLGAAVIFGIAWIAGAAGSLAALLVAGAFLIGVYASTRIVTVETEKQVASSNGHAATIPGMPLADGLVSRGLVINKLEFKQPAPVRQPKPSAN